MTKRLLYAAITVIGLVFVGILLGPYLRSLKFENPTLISATATTYDCADGHCVGFIISSVDNSDLSQYIGKTIYPYSSEKDKDTLQEQWAHLAQKTGTGVCIKGYLHKYPVNTMRLFQSGYGGYRIDMVDYKEGPCGT
ncbi:hypothetical protein HCH_05609 [Hahella chejuensis KCTC 2396]|uniref:Uncharacterized protein n=1 Tax=Hahella chejuensis (strain KCTC 2396) TaxID=349521 RepID=Q2SAQ7_HAHCH|nr:hypothetical protein [Hahella chejuensis]ABC32267.1 hypothetical protein HCH_05609 [Hahella chejuensis KCTC 2396]